MYYVTLYNYKVYITAFDNLLCVQLVIALNEMYQEVRGDHTHVPN